MLVRGGTIRKRHYGKLEELIQNLEINSINMLKKLKKVDKLEKIIEEEIKKMINWEKKVF